MGKKAAGEIRAGRGLLHGGGKGGHRPVVGVEHRAAFAHIGVQKPAEVGEFGELHLVIQGAVLAHPVGLVRLAADDAVADHHVREAKADGVEALQPVAQQRFHALAGGKHGRVARLLAEGGQVLPGDLPEDAMAACARAHQAREQQERIDDLLSAGKAGGEPVVLLEHAKISVHAGGEFHVRAANVHAHEQPPRGVRGQFGKHGRPALRARRFFFGGRQRGDVARREGEGHVAAEQGRERALVDVQALAVPRALALGRMHMKHAVQRLDKRRQFAVGGIKADLDFARTQRGKAVVEHGVEERFAESALLRRRKARQAQIKAARAVIVKVHQQRAGPFALAAKGVAHVADVNGPVGFGTLQKFLHARHIDHSLTMLAIPSSRRMA